MPKEFQISHKGQPRAEEGYLVMDWMLEPEKLTIDTPIHLAVEKMLRARHPNRDIIVTDHDGQYLGLLSPITLIKWLQLGGKLEERLSPDILIEGKVLNLYDAITEIPLGDVEVFPVVDNSGKVQGRLSSNALLLAYQQLLDEKNAVADAWDIVLETAYEGIVMVNSQGKIIRINEAYKNFLGVKEEDVLYKPVETIIDNTRLHITVKTGTPERGKLQVIQGQNMVVHRLPIWRNNKIVGAIGMLIFEGVSDIYRILEQVNEAKRVPHSLQEGSVHPTLDQPKVTFEAIKSKSHELAYCKSLARRSARTSATVLITGESGTGKEMFAQAIHHLSQQNKGAFVAVNCAAIPEGLLESELFGYEEGAFTGAKKGGRKGRFEQAGGGTIFLDEIGDMPLFMQAKILRVLQEKEIQPVGSEQTRTFSGRVIAATHVDLEEKVKKGEFREDLYYRLNVIHLQIPPLRERKQDIPVLLSHFIQHFCSLYHLPYKTFSNTAIEVLMNYDWPGNIREVMNLVESLVTLVDSEDIQQTDLPPKVMKKAFFHEGDVQMPIEKQQEQVALASLPYPLKKNQLAHEWQEIQNVIQACNGNKSEAARRLGIHRTTLYQKINRIKKVIKNM
ncbi:transcriptional regulator with PAS, ATPase and Fis domain [Pullulanibacillus pueri]|nr:transcriptional regulator with PAS, ATPase and Fis domain [Pullulanibacillus pueri]